MNFEEAKQKAIKYIGISKKTIYEVKQKLNRLGYNQDIIDEVISYLLDIGYLDDNDYAESYIRQCTRLLNYSIFEIKQKLLQKGIKKDIIEEKISFLYDTDYEKKITEKLLSTKCKNMDPIRIKQYLYRRGLKLYEEDL